MPLAPIGIDGPSAPRRPQAYAPILPGDPDLGSAEAHTTRIEEWIGVAAPLAGLDLAAPPRYRDSFRQAAYRENAFAIGGNLAARFVAGEAVPELLADGARRVGVADYQIAHVLDSLASYDLDAALDRMHTVAGKLERPFKAAVKALTEAARALPDPWLSKPDVVREFAGMDVPTWDEAGPLGQAARADRTLAPSVWAAEDALARLAACAVTSGGAGWLAEVVELDEEHESAGDDRLKLTVYAAHGCPDLALAAIAGGHLPAYSFKLCQP